MMDITFKSIVHAQRLSGIKIPKNVLLPSQLPVPISSSEEEHVHGSEEKHVHDSEDGREQDHWNANGDEANQVHSDSRSPMLDTIDKQTEPTVCSLLDGTGINVELALAKSFYFKRLAIQYRCRMGMLWCNLLMCGPTTSRKPHIHDHFPVTIYVLVIEV
jgi:hypothetical protein